MSARSIRTLLVDDEPLAREWLRGLLEAEPDIAVVGEAGNGVEAIGQVESLAPDLLFLDVQMPDLDGVGVMETLGERRPPCIVFCTAYDRFALRAFELHALDYLLKPFDSERLQKTLARVREHLTVHADDSLPRRLDALLATIRAERKPDRLAVKDGGKVVFVRVAEIDWIEAYGNYVKLHSGAATHLLLQTMTGMELRLDPNQFLRIHRSTIVNIDRIRSLEPLFHGEYSVKLAGGTELTLSRGYRDRVQALIDRFS